jgi:nicotinamide mononucleotide transporter
MAALIDWLNTTAFHVLGADVSRAEVLGDITGALSVWWAARQNVLNWPIGNINSALFLLLFVNAKLYANATLQVVFIVLGFYGWWHWLRGAKDEEQLPVRTTSPREWLAFTLVACAGQAAWYWLATRTDSHLPFWDSSVLVLSLVATWAMARKLVESWWIWIAVDAISVPLYWSQSLLPTALLYVVFAVICVIGLRDWRHSMSRPSPLAESVA